MTAQNTSSVQEKVSKYLVQSSDVISELKVNVSEENSEKVVWFKERFLSDVEIIEHVVHNPTSTVCWIIHRPKRGWYIRIRAPSFPQGVFISLMPLPRDSPHHADGALSFACRTSMPPELVRRTPSHTSQSSIDTQARSDGSSNRTATHSYPPTPPMPIVVQPPSPTAVHAKLDALRTNAIRRPRTQVTQFVLAPHSSPNVPQEEGSSLFTRALSMLRNSKPSHSFSFTLCPIPSSGSSVAPSSPTFGDSSSGSRRHSALLPSRPKPLLTFHDRTPILTANSTVGLLEIDQVAEQTMGIDTSFWVAVALTYLEFLEEKESYLAAVTD